MDLNIGLFQKKSTPPQWKASWKISWEGGSEPKNTSLGVTFDFIDVSVASIDNFSQNCFAFSNKFYYSFKLQTSYHIYLSFHPCLPLLLFSAFVEATCDNLKLLFIQNISPFLIGKTTRIIHHNQLLLTKFERILSYWTNDVKMTSKVQPCCRLWNRWLWKPGDEVELFW